jgi:hypothetical protein
MNKWEILSRDLGIDYGCTYLLVTSQDGKKDRMRQKVIIKEIEREGEKKVVSIFVFTILRKLETRNYHTGLPVVFAIPPTNQTI